MKQFTFFAKDNERGEVFTFTLDDLYGYEGEECGVFIRQNGTALSYNSGYGFKGMNPNLEIYNILITEDE